MNQQRLLSMLLPASALLVVASIAYAQVSPKKLPNPPKSVLQVPPGIKLASVSVKATCGQASRITVKVNYAKIISPEKIHLWHIGGPTVVDIPAGSGQKTVEINGATLSCTTPGNWAEAMQPVIQLGPLQRVVGTPVLPGRGPPRSD